MQQEIEVTKFSESLSNSLQALYRAGGLLLVFIFVGLILMLIGHFYASPVSNWIFGIGAATNVSCMGLFVYLQVRGPVRAAHILKENQELLNTIQEIALNLTEIINKSQSLMYKHSEDVSSILQQISPLLSQFPMLNTVDFSLVQSTNALILNTTEKSISIVSDVEEALIKADVASLKKYSEELGKATTTLRQVLSTSNQIVKLPNYKNISESLQGNLLELTETMEFAQASTLCYIGQIEDKLEAFMSVVGNFSFLGGRVSELGFSSIKDLSEQLRKLLSNSTEITGKLKQAIRSGDFEAVAEAIKELREISSDFKALNQKIQTSRGLASNSV